MSYQFEPQETARVGIRRIVSEEINEAIQRLSPPFENIDVDVHETRKNFKKIRAVLELIHEDIRPKTYTRENRFYRDMARQLAGARESYVALQTLETLLETYRADVGGKRPYIKIINRLKKTYAEQSGAVLSGDENPFEALITELKTARKRIKKWRFDHDDFRVLAGGLARVYAQGGKRMKQAEKDPDDIEALHEWRKRVKHLWYQMRLLLPIWEDNIASYVQQLDNLGELLGKEHDYADLEAIVLDLPDEICTPEAMYKLLAAIETERNQLRTQAFMMGDRIYAEKPEAFVKRHRAYWKLWQREAAKAEAIESIVTTSI